MALKIVNFEKCRTCIHYKEPEDNDICNDCLNNPVNVDSQIPINLKKNEEEIYEKQ